MMKKTTAGLSDGVFAVVDTETTNASPSYGRIMEIGILRIEQGTIVETFHSLVNPEREITPGVETITGITSEELAAAPVFPDIAARVFRLLDGATFVAHNAKFDYAFVRREFLRCRRSFTARCLDTIALSKKLFPEHLHHDLSSLIARYDLECDRRHRAFDDASALYAFLKKAEATAGTGAFSRALREVLNGSAPPHVDADTIRDLPDGPGVYLFYGENGELLYVGKSTNIRKRVQSHFSQATASGREFALHQQTRHIEARETVGELGALLLESRLIKELHPMHNRVSRSTQGLQVLLEGKNGAGYATVELETRDRIIPGEIPLVLTVFRNRRQAREYLAEVSKEFALCHKLAGLERPSQGPCFSYSLHRCHGACVGEEDPALYNKRFLQAFKERRIRTWPYRNGVLIHEYEEGNTSGEAFLVHQWMLLCSVKFSPDGYSRLEPSLGLFDYDSYRILERYLKTPRHRKSVRVLNAQEYGAMLAELDPAKDAL